MRRRLPMLDLETRDRASDFFRHQGCATHIRVGQYDDKFLAAIPRGVIAGSVETRGEYQGGIPAVRALRRGGVTAHRQYAEYCRRAVFAMYPFRVACSRRTIGRP
jgi:hypothetical protein